MSKQDRKCLPVMLRGGLLCREATCDLPVPQKASERHLRSISGFA